MDVTRRWDYAQDERDTEIAELKRRLVEAEHKAKEAATKAAEELQALTTEVQVCVYYEVGSGHISCCIMWQAFGTRHTNAALSCDYVGSRRFAFGLSWCCDRLARAYAIPRKLCIHMAYAALYS